MSRTHKDKPWSLGGKRTRYYISPKGHSAFKATIRRNVRAKERNAIARGAEPEPRYPVEKEYFD